MEFDDHGERRRQERASFTGSRSHDVCFCLCFVCSLSIPVTNQPHVGEAPIIPPPRRNRSTAEYNRLCLWRQENVLDVRRDRMGLSTIITLLKLTSQTRVD